MYTNEDKINHALILYLPVSSARTSANSLYPDQAQQNVGPDLDPNCLTLMVFLKEFFITLTANSLDPDQAKQNVGT